MFNFARVALVALLTAGTCSFAADAVKEPVAKGDQARAEQKAPPEALVKALEEGIKLIEDKKHDEFIKRFVHPDEKAMLEKHGFEKVVQGFSEKAAELLKVLKHIKDQKATLNADGSEATFKVSDSGAKTPQETITFAKKDDKWYLKN